MGFPDYKRDLLAPDFDANRILDRYFHSGPSFALIGAHPETEALLKGDLARSLYDSLGVRVHPLQLVVCGSAHLGFSPVPTDEKFGRPFDSQSSDIDFAVVLPELFDRCWAELQQSQMLIPADRARVADDLFWGFINPANVFNICNTGSNWWRVFGNLRTDRAKALRGRLYRDYWSMQSYHRYAIDGGRKRLLNMQA